MKNNNRLNSLGLISCLVVATGLAACGGDDGDSDAAESGGSPGVGGATGYTTGGTTGYTTGGTTGTPTGGTTGTPTGGTTGTPTGGTTGTPTGGTTGTPTGGTTSTTTGGTTSTTTGGTTSATTGGTTGTTTGGGGGASGATTGPDLTDYKVDEGGFITACNFTGYAWTSAGPDEPNNETGSLSSVDPASFSDIAAGGLLCATGSVAEDADYNGTAMIGVNIGQEAGEETPNANVTVTGTGLYVSVTNNGPSDLRIQIQDDLGGTDATHRWCADLPSGGTGTIPWTEFNTQCWEGGDGVDYAMEPINAVLVLVPGSNEEDRAFDFCLDGFTVEGAECVVQTGGGGAGGGTGVGGSAGGGTGVGGSAGVSGAAGAAGAAAGGAGGVDAGAGGASGSAGTAGVMEAGTAGAAGAVSGAGGA